jgi:phosphatidylglycerol lysyltransferase
MSPPPPAYPVFRNVYEETKHHAETVIHQSNLPWIILRPSIIMGHSISGEAESDKMVYGVMKLYHRLEQYLRRKYRDSGGPPEDLRFYVNARPDVTKNCIVVDDVVRLMMSARHNGKSRCIYHLCNPRPTHIGELHELLCQVVGIRNLFLCLTPSSNADRNQAMIDMGLKNYIQYMIHDDPVFDMTNTSQIVDLNTIKPFDRYLQLFLYRSYYANRLTKRIQSTHSGIVPHRLEPLKQYGDKSLSYYSIFNSCTAFRLADCEGFLPYVVSDNTAVMLGDPVSNNGSALIDGFISRCRSQNQNPAAIQITHSSAEMFNRHGFIVNKFGIETWIDLTRYDPAMSGKAYAKFRLWRNNSMAHGLTVEEKGLSGVNLGEVQGISENWLKKKKNHFELGVLLRKMRLVEEPFVRRFFACLNGKIIGYVFFDPVFLHQRIIGYAVDIQRYHSDGSPSNGRIHGAVPYMIIQAMARFKSEGVKWLSLGLSPLDKLDDNPFRESPDLKRLFTQLYQENQLYAFQGIAQHKRQYPSGVIVPVYFAAEESSGIENILNILNSIGLLGAM